MKKILLILIFSLLSYSPGFAKELLNCENIKNGQITKINFYPKTQTWTNETLQTMDGKFVNGNFYAVIEFGETDKYLIGTIKYNTRSKKLFINLYKMSSIEASEALMSGYVKYMNEKKVFDVKDINNKDGQYIFFNSIEDNFSPSANEISYCEKKIKSNTSGDILNLPNILKNPDKITKSQLVEFLIEYSYIIKKATIHLKKCIDEQSLYNSVGKKYCSSVGPKMGELYIPAEKALKKVFPIITEAYDKYKNLEVENVPAWFVKLNEEINILNSNNDKYFKAREEVKALFAAANAN
jgi:hypothetical protein